MTSRNVQSGGEPQAIESVLHESRRFDPPAAAALGFARWHVSSLDEYKRLHAESLANPERFWGDVASELFWFDPPRRVLEWTPPDARWFVGGTTNVSFNCLDRHVNEGRGENLALLWEGEPLEGGKPEVRRLTYADLLHEVGKLANVLRALGVKKGDVVTIYMGMVPELAVAMLACARIGAPHSVIFGGFSSQAIVDRVSDAGSRVILTCDGAWRRGKVVPLKENVDAACATLEGAGRPVQHVVTLRRCHNPTVRHEGRDHDWHDLMLAASSDCPAVPLDAEHPLFLLYTSGSTGKPKGILHTTGGYMVYTAFTARTTFNLGGGADAPGARPGQGGSLYWCTADCGWVTGHSYIVYGILPTGVPTVMYEGAPNFPAEDRFWDIIERHKVTHFYTAPTAIRAFMKWGQEHADKHDLSSLRVLGSVGEPINPEAWMWYHRVIGGERCPIVDTYWQTETGGHVITPLPGAIPTVPGSCTLPFFGIDAAVVSEKGEELPPNTGGLLVIRRPWPGMLRGVFGDRQRYIDTYWSRVSGPDMMPGGDRGERVAYYTAGDAARRDDAGNFWIMGRIDDVINVSGHRLGTMEVESALVSHEAVVEAAVVGMPHEIKGTGIAAFVTLEPHFHPSEKLKEDLRRHVEKEIGAIAKPDAIRFTQMLPKTRSGKIMRRLLRDIAAGVERISQDTTTLEDFSVLAKLRETDES